MSRATVAVLLLCMAALVCGVLAGPPSSCRGAPNTVPVVQFNGASKVVRRVTNGTLEAVMPNGASTPLLVAHIYGSDYDMGVAYGSLLADEISTMLPLAYQYFSDAYKVPAWLVNEVLDVTINTTKAFTPKHHFQFLHGVADGSGGKVAYEDVLRMAMIPEAIKATCSIAGMWGQATADGGLIQLRALDWGTDGPFQQFALLTTFHPNDGSFSYSSLGWVGLYGTLTGWSSSNLAVSEKVWLGYKGIDNIYGYPWTLMLADIMRFDVDVDAALARIGGASRTCSIWLGIGQGAHTNPRNSSDIIPANFKLVASAWQELHFYNPENFPVYKNHDYFPDLVYVNKHVQPSDDPCMNDVFHWKYGNITGTDIFTYVTALQQTGDMHIAVMDFDAKQLYVANALPMPNNVPAYKNGFVQFDASQLWSKPHPAHDNMVADF